MSAHAKALVPAEAWCYNSPEVCFAGRSVDVGLIAEALLYYDSIAVSVGNHEQFAELIAWFVSQKQLPELLALIREGVISFYDYSFITSAILTEEGYSIWNIQDPIQAQPGTFAQRYLYQPTLQKSIPHARHRQQLFRALEGRVVEVKSDAFSPAIDNARADILDARRHAIVLQAYVDALYPILHLGRPPTVQAVVTTSSDGAKHHITWNVNLEELKRLSGILGFHHGTPLAGVALSNRYLWSAAQERWDLYLGQPMATLVGDKLYESVQQPAKAGAVIGQLKERVEFPDIRRLVNEGKVSFSELLVIRKKAVRFRAWLQSESERDRDAIIAYHHEVAKESGLLSFGRKTLNLFGILGGGAVGSVIGTVFAGPIGSAVGGVAGSGATYLLDIASKIGADWKPVVFGNWLQTRIEEHSTTKNL